MLKLVGILIPRPISHAEWLIDLAEKVLYPTNRLLFENSKTSKEDIELGSSRIALALKLYNMPGEVKLRAIVEEWEPARIVRELY
jgi:hypothetical protein